MQHVRERHVQRTLLPFRKKRDWQRDGELWMQGTYKTVVQDKCKEIWIIFKVFFVISNIFQVHFKVYYKMLSQYFQVGYFPKFDYCQFIQTADNNNVLYNGVKFLKKLMPESVRKCPYDNEQLQINDLLLTDDDFKVLPRGKYKVICTFSDDDDKKILRMITHVTV